MATIGPSAVPDEPRRFSIRPLWIGVAAVVLIVGGVALRIGLPAYRQHVAINEIERVGGSVIMRPRGPQWVRDWTASETIELLDQPMWVYLMDSRADDATLAHLSALTTVESLGLNNTRVSDAGLVHLKGLNSLEVLRLDGTRVTDAGLSHLKGLRSLVLLGLDDTGVTDAGLTYLKRLTSLQQLRLNGTRVTAMGVAELRQALPSLAIDDGVPAPVIK